MRSIPLAMTWELLQRGRWTLLAGLLGSLALPILLFAALRNDGALQANDPAFLIMHVVLMQVNLASFGAVLMSAQGNPSRLYAYPAPNSTLIAWHLLPSMVLVAAETLFATAVINALFHMDWPYWGPALFAPAALAAIMATLWLTEKSGWLPVSMAAVASALGLWFKTRYGPTFSNPTSYWRETTAVEVVTLFAVIAAAWGVGVAALNRNRRGDPALSLGIVAWLARFFDDAPAQRQPFADAARAQTWHEWRQKGWAMPTVVVLGIICLLTVWAISIREPQELLGGFAAGGGMLSMMSLVIALIMGNCGPHDGNYSVSPYLAIRPLATPDLARITLKVAAQSVLLSWTIWAVSFLAIYLVLRLFGIESDFDMSDWGAWYFPATLLGPWIIVGVGASAGMTGRSAIFVKLICAALAAYIGLALFAKYALTREEQAAFGRGVTGAFGVACLLGTIFAFAIARRRGMVGWPAIVASAGVWTALAALVVVVVVRSPHPVLPLSFYLFATGLTALVVAPLATAPIALAWNRNR